MRRMLLETRGRTNEIQLNTMRSSQQLTNAVGSRDIVDQVIQAREERDRLLAQVTRLQALLDEQNLTEGIFDWNDTITELTARRCEVEIRATPLQYACLSGNLATVRLLVGAGAHLFAYGHWTASSIAPAFYMRGVLPNPLACARHQGHLEIARFIERTIQHRFFAFFRAGSHDLPYLLRRRVWLEICQPDFERDEH
eukprot:c54528_g1_i1.p1 GENE.c54528_g1_i1~~c54528_g1_i1.p1  ORF type:complete len:197 (+),score=26.64 c54528_g1_i1:192-782(+)